MILIYDNKEAPSDHAIHFIDIGDLDRQRVEFAIGHLQWEHEDGVVIGETPSVSWDDGDWRTCSLAQLFGWSRFDELIADTRSLLRSHAKEVYRVLLTDWIDQVRSATAARLVRMGEGLSHLDQAEKRIREELDGLDKPPRRPTVAARPDEERWVIYGTTVQTESEHPDPTRPAVLFRSHLHSSISTAAGGGNRAHTFLIDVGDGAYIKTLHKFLSGHPDKILSPRAAIDIASTIKVNRSASSPLPWGSIDMWWDEDEDGNNSYLSTADREYGVEKFRQIVADNDGEMPSLIVYTPPVSR